MRKRALAAQLVIVCLLAGAGVSWLLGFSSLALLAVLAALLLVLAWLGLRLLRAFLWKVGRQLTFSYFLIGLLPIPMVVLLLGVALYLLAGALVGHLFRDHLQMLHLELQGAAEAHLARLGIGTGETPATQGEAVVALYRRGHRVSGDPRAPLEWPSGLDTAEESGEGPAAPAGPRVFLDSAGEPTLAVSVEGEGIAALALPAGDLDERLSRRSGVWVELEHWRPSQEERQPVQIQIGGARFTLGQTGALQRRELRDRFFGVERDLPLWDRPLLFWAELLGPATSLGGEPAEGSVGAILNATPRTVLDQLASSSTDVDASAWGLLVGLAFLLFDIYFVALLMALFMVFGLTRAVNRLSRATSAVQRGDFSVRIPVRRRDQLGELQRSFNQMAENLERLVAATALKESMEKELEIARELQRSLLPTSLAETEAVEFASFFEPSAAIGGDYFDLLHLDGGRLAVVVADVAGHGLSAGLRMAMLKAALQILAEQGLPAPEILARLDQMVRSEDRRGAARALVTAVVAIFDPASGELQLTNAGHPPTYVIRDGSVEEILLPGSPLGGIGGDYGARILFLAPGDVAVWLSDGLIEGTDDNGNSFGYERVAESLAHPFTSAAQARDRLLSRVATHTGNRPPEDDRTLVAMRFLSPAGAGPAEA